MLFSAQSFCSLCAINIKMHQGDFYFQGDRVTEDNNNTKKENNNNKVPVMGAAL